MKRIFFIILICTILIQFIRPEQTNPIVIKEQEIVTPKKVSIILKNACYDCHSNNTKWPYYSKIAPISWYVSSRINEGREALNFSIWNTYDEEKKKKKLKRMYKTVYSSMPLASYIKFHEEADLTKEQREEIRTWTGVRR